MEISPVVSIETSPRPVAQRLDSEGAIEVAATCLHAHLVYHTTGSIRFVDGEVYDDIHEALICMDCMQEVEPMETPSTETVLPF